MANAYVAPRSQAEERLAQIWAEVLSLDQVGIEDNFFDLGGHSLLASRVMSRIHDTFHVRVQLRSFYEAPTVASLAAYIERTRLEERETKDLSIARVSRDGPFLLSFAQQRLWFLNQLEPDSPAYNQPKALRLLGDLKIEALQKALDAIVMRHEVLRSSFASTDGRPVQIVNESRPVELSIIDASEWPAQQREKQMRRLLREISQQPFDLCRDLMLRAAIFRLRKSITYFFW